MAESGPLRVLHVFSGDLWAGAEVMVYRLLTRLNRDPGLSIVALGLNEGELTARLRDQGVETLVIEEQRHSLPAIARLATRKLAGRRIDVIHGHRYKENLLALWLAWALGVPRRVSTLHGLPESGPAGKGARVKRYARERLDRAVLRWGFDTVVAVSEEMKRALVTRYGFPPSAVEVIHNGIDLPPDAVDDRRADGRPLRIGSVGRLVPVKGFELFLDTAARIRARVPNVHFSILGDGPLREALCARAEALGLAGAFEIVPPTPDPWPFYRSLDLYVNTSVHEGLPLSILEAMAAARPVVAPRVGGIPEVIVTDEEGALVDGRDPQAFAEACLTLLQDGERRRRVGLEARRAIARRFDAATMARAYRTLYDRP